MKKKLNQNLLIETLDLSAGTQQRQLSPDVIKHYAELRKDGIVFPPVEVIHTGKKDILWDGFHRVAVAKKLGDTHIRANVEIGNERHAVWMSYQANSQHGYPRQSGATKFIVDKILDDPEWKEKSMSDIARHVGCSRQYVFERKNDDSCQVLDKTDSPEAPTERGAVLPRIETEPKSPLQDDEGQVIPPPLADRFLSRSVIKERINELDRIKNAVTNKIGEGDLTFCLLNQTGFQHDMANLRARLDAAIPYALCPYCKAEGCGACHNMGFLNEETWKAAPKNQGE